MSADENRCYIPPFPADYRASGLLLHVTSLPSPYGIGDLGPAAYAWINRLEQAGQRWWQALPLGPTGYGNSPYQALSSFAGNSLIISPELLNEDGLLELRDALVSFDDPAVDYESVIPFKRQLVEMAWARFQRGTGAELRLQYEEFCAKQASWLEDYALFRALKAKYQGVSYLDWPAALVRRHPGALAEARRELAAEMDVIRFAQFMVTRQGERLKTYAHSKGVGLIGDLPFFVSPDSSDVWANPELFLLDERRRPKFVAGVPPDYFSAQGQLWGNPVYNWDALRVTGYRWCIDRFRALLSHVDLVRLDHFRGFAAGWHVPAGAPTAQSGSWEPGPGAEFFEAVQTALGGLPFIAEDLGLITPDVERLRDRFLLPGTRVLQFAFDGHEDNPHLPRNFANNTVVYTGTHDNPPSREWFDELTDTQRQILSSQYFDRVADENIEAGPALMTLAWHSRAALAMAPLQDLLNLGREARMNVPGIAGGNWRWRCTEAMLTDEPFAWLEELTAGSKRLAPSRSYRLAS
ncbi:MAG: 4-alpha-glucanotransferase [Terriglobia bacterium]|nr:MAG: 4-alpha-glucanotransferase [Terriglobia bacterium]